MTDPAGVRAHLIAALEADLVGPFSEDGEVTEAGQQEVRRMLEDAA